MFRAVRFITFIFSIIFAIVVLGLAGHLLHVSHHSYRFSSNVFASLAIATSTITIVFLAIVLIFNHSLKHPSDHFVRKVVCELVCLFVVWALWLATAANTARFNRDFFRSCSFFNGFVSTTCREVRTVEAFAWIIWIMLMIYFLALLFHAATKGSSPATPVGGQPGDQQGTSTAPQMEQAHQGPAQSV